MMWLARSIAAMGFAVAGFVVALTSIDAAEPLQLDSVSAEQARQEQEVLKSGEQRTFTDDMAAYRQTAQNVKYPADGRELPGYLYLPRGAGKHPAVLWNHGSEKEPRAQPELARFYTEHGFVFFAPIRHGHGTTAGPYIVDLQNEARDKLQEMDAIRREQVRLHEVYNADVVAAIAWLKQQPQVDAERIIVTGVSYGGIQTLLTAEKGLGVRGFVAFAPGAMSFANVALQERMKEAAKKTKAPLLLLQAKNDYSTGPSEILAPILKAKEGPSHSTVYPAFGTTNQQGHGAFATWSLGTQQWGAEVLAFIDAAFKQ
jgi:dienelactone hydrolase